MCSSSFPSVRTNWPLLQIAIAVPVSWQPGRIKFDAILAFFNKVIATNLSFSVASESFKVSKNQLEEEQEIWRKLENKS